jgi:hypothetical protein
MIRCSAVQLRQSKSSAKRTNFTYFDDVAERIAKPQFDLATRVSQRGCLVGSSFPPLLT